MGKGGGSSTTVQKADPWSGIQPGLLDAAGDLTKLYDSGKLKQDFYPGSTVVDYSPETEQALNLTKNRALNGSAVSNAGKGLITDTLNGKYLDVTTAPGYSQMMDDLTSRYQKGTAAQTDAAFNQAGAFGGSAYRETTQDNQRTFADSMSKAAGDLYQAERGKQLQAGLLAPQYAASDYDDYQRLADVGAARDSINTAKTQEQIDRYYANSEAPINELSNYINFLNQIGGNYQTNTATGKTASGGSGLNGAIGGAASGAGLATALGASNPWIAGAAGIGGLLGLFG